MAAVIGYRSLPCQRTLQMSKKRATHDEVVITKCIRIPVPLQVLSNTDVLPILPRSPASYQTSCRRIESQHVIYHSPHIGVDQSPWLTEYGEEVIPSPLKCSMIARNAESHLGLRYRYLWVPIQEPQEVGVCARIEDDLLNNTLSFKHCFHSLLRRTKPLREKVSVSNGLNGLAKRTYRRRPLHSL